MQKGGQYRTARNGRSVIPRSQITALEPMGIMLSIVFEDNRDSSGLPLKNVSTTLMKRITTFMIQDEVKRFTLIINATYLVVAVVFVPKCKDAS